MRQMLNAFKTSWRGILLVLLTLVILVDFLLMFRYKEYITPKQLNLTKETASHRWISFYEVGGIGNGLFNLAAIVGLSKEHNLEVVIAKKMKFFPIFELRNLTVYDDVKDAPGHFKVLREKKYHDCRFDPTLTQRILPEDNHSVILWGYFQSWRYFSSVRQELRGLLTLTPFVNSSATEYIRGMVTKHFQLDDGQYVLIGIHVRHGDMTVRADLVAYGYPTVPVSYYEHAVEHFEKKLKGQTLVFVVCSDDKAWAKSNLQHLHKNVFFSGNLDAGIDLAILSHCQHVIISMGTFGWWGAWLSGGDAVYYEDWPKNGSALAKSVDKDDYFLPSWMGMT